MNFDISINRLLDTEKGYVNNPADPGGETNWGISKRSYPDVDIRNLTREGAIAIYKRDFWDVINGDALPLLVSFQLLDFSVNASIVTAIRKAQQAVGVADDGHWGPVTNSAITGAIAAGTFTPLFAAAKIRYYTKLTTFAIFGAGWMNRVATDLEDAAQDIGK